MQVVLAKGLDKKHSKGTAADTVVSAFVMPNDKIDPDTPLAAFVVSLEPLESIAGESRDIHTQGHTRTHTHKSLRSA